MIYLIHGADSFRAREKLNELIAEFRKKDSGNANLDIFGEEEIDIKKIKAASETLGFLSPLRTVIVKDLFGGKNEAKKPIADFVLLQAKKNGSTFSKNSGQASSSQANGADFIFFESREINKTHSPAASGWNALAKAGKAFKFDLLGSSELRNYILDKFKKEKIKINPSAATKLALYVGDDLWRMSAEIEKLILLKADINSQAPKNIVITNEDIEAIVKSDLPVVIFSTTDALISRNKKQALNLLASHLEKGDEPLYLFSMFVSQFRNLLKIKDIMEKNKISQPEEIARILKLHPFVVKKNIPAASKFKYEYLKKVYKRFLRFDFLIKKGRLDPKAALEMIVIEVGNLS